MKTKNILIAICVLGIGFILYKLLLGFVLPIALFVSLGYVLKFLLRGPEADPVQEFSQVLTNSDPTSSIENIVEIKAIKEDKSNKEDKPVTEDKNVNEDKNVKEDKNIIS